MHQLVEQFRDATRDRPKNGPPTARYSEEQRQLALRYLAKARKRGRNARQVAMELGIDSNTLRSWGQRADAGRPRSKRPKALMPVRIAEASTGPLDLAASFVVRMPGGVHVECASAGAVVELLRLIS